MCIRRMAADWACRASAFAWGDLYFYGELVFVYGGVFAFGASGGGSFLEWEGGGVDLAEVMGGDGFAGGSCFGWVAFPGGLRSPGLRMTTT